MLDPGSFVESDMFVEHRCSDFGMAADKNKVSVHNGSVSLQTGLSSCGPTGLPTKLMKSFWDSAYIEHFLSLGPWNAGVPLEKHYWSLQVPSLTFADEGR